MGLKKCFYCGKDIPRDSTEYQMIPLERPYVNLFFHRECFILAGSYSGIDAFLTERSDKVYNYTREYKNAKQK